MQSQSRAKSVWAGLVPSGGSSGEVSSHLPASRSCHVPWLVSPPFILKSLTLTLLPPVKTLVIALGPQILR